jgi:hypothetical protein
MPSQRQKRAPNVEFNSINLCHPHLRHRIKDRISKITFTRTISKLFLPVFTICKILNLSHIESFLIYFWQSE